jgi:two-component system, chemotaxis family, protein-glutamate methylesterase/glutaminase
MDNKKFIIAGIGLSAGGLPALLDLLSNISDNSHIAFVIIPHRWRKQRSQLDIILAKKSSLKIIRITDNEKVTINCIYVLPENQTVTISEGRLHLKERETNEIINSAIDTFFHSLGHDQKERAVGIILSGMGSDGSEGIKTIEENGGTIMVQEPDTAQFDSMPIAAIIKDHPDYILSPHEMAINLLDIAFDLS